jgi:hypothetical protein
MFQAKLEYGRASLASGGKFTIRTARVIAFGVAAAIGAPFAACADQREAAAKLLARTMTNPELRIKTFGGGAWQGNGDSYLALEPAAAGGGSDIVRYQTATGAREILVAAERLIPAGEKTPLAVEAYRVSPDGHRVWCSQIRRPCGARTRVEIIGFST